MDHPSPCDITPLYTHITTITTLFASFPRLESICNQLSSSLCDARSNFQKLLLDKVVLWWWLHPTTYSLISISSFQKQPIGLAEWCLKYNYALAHHSDITFISTTIARVQRDPRNCVECVCVCLSESPYILHTNWFVLQNVNNATRSSIDYQESCARPIQIAHNHPRSQRMMVWCGKLVNASSLANRKLIS